MSRNSCYSGNGSILRESFRIVPRCEDLEAKTIPQVFQIIFLILNLLVRCNWIMAQRYLLYLMLTLIQLDIFQFVALVRDSRTRTVRSSGTRWFGAIGGLSGTWIPSCGNNGEARYPSFWPFAFVFEAVDFAFVFLPLPFVAGVSFELGCELTFEPVLSSLV